MITFILAHFYIFMFSFIALMVLCILLGHIFPKLSSTFDTIQSSVMMFFVMILFACGAITDNWSDILVSILLMICTILLAKVQASLDAFDSIYKS